MRISDWRSDVCSSDLGDHVGAGRPRGADADADVAGAGAGVALGHVGGALDVAGQDMVDRLALLHGGVERVDRRAGNAEGDVDPLLLQDAHGGFGRSEEHTSELQSLMRISYAVFCLKKKKKNTVRINNNTSTQQR